VEEIKLWKIVTQQDAKPRALPVENVTETTTEELLEEVLTGAPDLLMPSLRLVGRQTETQGGPLDLLGVDEDGRLVVFELKRGRLTREAVAQAIDYASTLAALEAEDLCRHIEESSGKNGIETIADFGQWYQNQFQRPVAEIGVPRVTLVGLGVDEKAKRMVEFLAKCELDISLVTFHGFRQEGETLLARQVEVRRAPVKSTKLENKAKLERLLDGLGVAQSYDELTAALQQGIGDSAYQWPNPAGYSFSLPEIADSGGPTLRSYVALYAPEARKGAIQVNLQARAIEAVGKEHIEQIAGAMGSKLTLKPTGWGEIWIDGHKPTSGYLEHLRALGEAISAGQKAKMQKQVKAEAAEADAKA